MIAFEVNLVPSRINKERVSDLFENGDEIFLLLKDIQENILDKYFDCDRYAAQMISLDFLEVFDIDMSKAFSIEECKEYDLTDVIMDHLNELSSNDHILQILELKSANFLSDTIDPLLDCYLPTIGITRPMRGSDDK